jgi:hypothetical protein
MDLGGLNASGFASMIDETTIDAPVISPTVERAILPG